MDLEDSRAQTSSSGNLLLGSNSENQKKECEGMWGKKMNGSVSRKKQIKSSEEGPCIRHGRENKEAKATSAIPDKPGPKINLMQQMLESIPVFHPHQLKFPVLPTKKTLQDRRPSEGVIEQPLPVVAIVGRRLGKPLSPIPKASTSTPRPPGYFMPQPPSVKMRPYQLKETPSEIFSSYTRIEPLQCQCTYVPIVAGQVLQPTPPLSQPPQTSRGRQAFSRAAVLPSITTAVVESVQRPTNRPSMSTRQRGHLYPLGDS